ncbi:hypothetical protein QI633_11305 [Nocardioides sp. QY071]|uniref:hypothetical protein n=1 Tax=Nocardioides sp. QY071 TaxID=3044187 RepID=UPI00249AE3E2|nr:hypothetical protein [Nocardioides sp. QY071]WGY04333.1 hypothetical protein QI633_11305 [Nocardioides sp. QY071]
MPDHSPDVEIVEVTPQLAETWLSRNTNNRNVRRSVIDAYARDIAAGRWRLNGETIKFGPSGVLLDGQHRLGAVVQADTSVPMVVVRNLSDDVMSTVDTGAKRSYADALKLAGEENTTTLAAVVRRAVMWERGMRTNTGAIKPTALEMDDFLDRTPEIRASADLASRLASRERLPASVIGLCHFLFSKIDPDAATTFFLRVADGDGIPATDPIAVLRNRVIKLRVSGGRINETEGLALTIRAWNAHRAGETRTKLQMPKGGLTNENFPEPK